MAQIIEGSNWAANTGASFGNALNRLADKKIQQMDARHAQEAKLKALTGTGVLSREQAAFISALPEKDQFEAAQGMAQNREPQKAPAQDMTSHFNNAGIPEADHKGFGEFLNQYQSRNAQEMQQESLNSGQRQPVGVAEVLQQLQARNAPQEQQQQAALQEQALGRQEQEYRPQQQEQRPAERRYPLGVPKSQTGERRHQETMELRRQQIEATNEANLRKEEAGLRKEIAPFVKGQHEDFKNSRDMKKVATRMLENLRENKKKFPTGLKSYTPETLLRDPSVRDYARDANKLVLLSAGARKGQPTNFKVKLEQQAKVGLNQPLESQEQGLIDIINDTNEVETRQHIFDDIRKKHAGKLPSDIAELVDEQYTAMGQLPGKEQKFSEGSQWQTDSGHLFEYTKGSWVPIQ